MIELYVIGNVCVIYLSKTVLHLVLSKGLGFFFLNHFSNCLFHLFFFSSKTSTLFCNWILWVDSFQGFSNYTFVLLFLTRSRSSRKATCAEPENPESSRQGGNLLSYALRTESSTDYTMQLPLQLSTLDQQYNDGTSHQQSHSVAFALQ